MDARLRNARPATGATQAQSHALAALIERLRGAIVPDRTRVDTLLKALGEASFIPVLLVPALVVVSPLSGIPVLPSLCGLAIVLIAAQMIVGRQHLWLPRWLLARSMDSARLHQALELLDRPANWIDAITAQRMGWLTGPPLRALLLVACLCAGLAMPFLELLPFTSSLLAGAVTLIAVGLLVRDGLLAMLGLGLIGGAVALLIWLLG